MLCTQVEVCRESWSRVVLKPSNHSRNLKKGRNKEENSKDSRDKSSKDNKNNKNSNKEENNKDSSKEESNKDNKEENKKDKDSKDSNSVETSIRRSRRFERVMFLQFQPDLDILSITTVTDGLL